MLKAAGAKFNAGINRVTERVVEIEGFVKGVHYVDPVGIRQYRYKG